MAGPDLAVSSVVVSAQTKLRASTAVAGDSLEQTDLGDCLAISSWALSAGSDVPPIGAVPMVRRILPAQPGTAVQLFDIELDAALEEGRGYQLALTPSARSAGGQNTSTAAFPFLGRVVGAIAGVAKGLPGADLGFPLVADAAGDLAPVDRERALRARIALLVASRRGSFRFEELSTFGRGFEAKRSYSVGALQLEAQAIEALLTDPEKFPDVRSARVLARPIAQHAVAFDMLVTPRFATKPIVISETMIAGGS